MSDNTKSKVKPVAGGSDKKARKGSSGGVSSGVPRLYLAYQQEIKASLVKTLGVDNIMEVPQVTKIVLNMGVGEATQDRKHIEIAQNELSLIAGQRAVRTKAGFAEAAFKLRAGMAIGCKVTLRRQRMYEFLDRLVNIALPRVRDFRGLNQRSFDGHGNFALGLKEQIVFPEIDYDKADRVRGLDVVICTSTQNDDHAFELLKAFNLPFEGERVKKPALKSESGSGDASDGDAEKVVLKGK